MAKPKPADEPEAVVEPATPTRFRNVSPLGALEVPAIGRIIQHGEVFKVSVEIAELLAPQSEHYEPTADEVGIPGDDVADEPEGGDQ